MSKEKEVIVMRWVVSRKESTLKLSWLQRLLCRWFNIIPKEDYLVTAIVDTNVNYALYIGDVWVSSNEDLWTVIGFTCGTREFGDKSTTYPLMSSLASMSNICLSGKLNLISRPYSEDKESYAEYVIEASKEGRLWKEQARFKKGQRSRFDGIPFNAKIAIREAEAFRSARTRDGWSYVRVVILI